MTAAMAICASERQSVLDIFHRMAYSHTAEDYSDLRHQLQETGLDYVVTYFKEDWHPLRAEWAKCFLTEGTFGKHTNNRLESINQKIKSVCSVYSNLNGFFRELLTVLTCLRVERHNVALNCVSNVSVSCWHANALPPHVCHAQGLWTTPV